MKRLKITKKQGKKIMDKVKQWEKAQKAKFNLIQELEYFYSCTKRLAIREKRTLGDESAVAFKRICRLIKNGSRVSREFVTILAGEFSTYNFQKKHPNEVFDLLLKRFKEAGIEIEGEEKEA